MNPEFKLTENDIKMRQENVLEMFYSGIKSQATKETLQRLLRYFLIDVCADLLQGDFSQRAQQFVVLASQDQIKATNIIIAYVKKLRERIALDKSHQYYINPSYLPNNIKPIKKLLIMNMWDWHGRESTHFIQKKITHIKEEVTPKKRSVNYWNIRIPSILIL